MIGDRKKRRVRLIAMGGALLVGAAALAGFAFNDAIVFFVAPTDLVAKAQAGEAGPERRLRLGGLVENGSLAHEGEQIVVFRVTDNKTSLPVRFDGVLPDLFREGQGVVAEGYFREGKFEAETILAKHDENYMPREVTDALKDSGDWKPN